MTPLSPVSPEELLTDPSYSRLKDYLIESTGLVYYADKDADLARRIRRRWSELSVSDCASYLERLRDPIRGTSEMDALIAEVTIGETYFFRHREHFDALRDLMVPDLISRNAGKRSLRIWCAGCADGSEPYSLSILLQRDLRCKMPGWNVSILGTDINRQALANAQEGKFEDWSFRSTPDDVRTACFEKNGKQWTIAPHYKAGVSFQFHNLAEGIFPPPFNNASSFDLIICRNVMIYFGPDLMRRIVRQFHACLAPGGWLLVGPTEPNMTSFPSFRVVNAPGVTLYQKTALPSGLSADAGPVPAFVPTAAVMQVDSSPPNVQTPPAFDSPAPTLADLRRYADQGDWENAASRGRELIESDNLNAVAHFHYALILEQLGSVVEAERSLRRAIYLDRRAVLAHYHLGLLLGSRGDTRHAERCIMNALNLLATLPAQEIVPEADGMTAAELVKLAEAQIERLGVRA